MKEKIKKIVILVAILVLIGGLIAGLFIWKNKEKTDRKYQKCLDICEFEEFGRRKTPFVPLKESICTLGCEEKYDK